MVSIEEEENTRAKGRENTEIVIAKEITKKVKEEREIVPDQVRRNTEREDKADPILQGNDTNRFRSWFNDGLIYIQSINKEDSKATFKLYINFSKKSNKISKSIVFSTKFLLHNQSCTKSNPMRPKKRTVKHVGYFLYRFYFSFFYVDKHFDYKIVHFSIFFKTDNIIWCDGKR